jgi:flagellar secretion chaperone FliS
MWRNAHDTYLEDRILSADPIELVHMLYQGCSTAVDDARRHLAEGDILGRARSISKACDILMELATSLDYQRGGAISEQFAQLYAYMHRLLLEANGQQNEAPLIEVAGLLATLQEAWEAVRQDSRKGAARETSWLQAIPQEPQLAHAGGGWSF